MKLFKSKDERNQEFSKYITEIAFKTGRNVIYACLILSAYAIHKELNTAAYLTGAIAVGEGLMMLVVKWYLGLAQADHSAGGITYESAKASGFNVMQETMNINNETEDTTI